MGHVGLIGAGGKQKYGLLRVLICSSPGHRVGVVPSRL